jgi:hypothetical protein
MTLALYPPQVVNRFRETWGVGSVQPFGPSGFLWDGHDTRIIVTQADHGDGIEVIHASISHPDRYPSYKEMAALHRAVFGRKRWSYQCFAPEVEHVNIHEHTLHLWGRADGQPFMPNFGALGSI